MESIQITFDISPAVPWKEIITHELAEIGFESFMEEGEQLLAYIPKDAFKEDNLSKLMDEYRSKEVIISTTKKIIPHQNWNAIWESDYEPVKVGKRLYIRAPFHPEDDQFELSIEIQPQMSFGTGHHSTTYLLSEVLLDLELENKSVLDVGTGTGVLGIISSKKGAQEVIGTDIEEGAVENTKENIERNKVANFSVIHGDIECVPLKKVDIILANINKNVLLKHLSTYADRISPSGYLLLSGFFETDKEELITASEKEGFHYEQSFIQDTWAVLKFKNK
jgi:ribosomal protein L11 methyltransferase